MSRQENHSKIGVWGIVVIIAMSNISLYGLPYMRDQFYDVIIEALGVSHSRLSLLFSIFGTVSLFSYVLGGPVVDRLSTKKLMCVSLVASGIMHLYVTTGPPYWILCIIFGCMAIAACFTFYPASMKLLNSLKEKGGKGKIFGFYVSIISTLGIGVVLIGVLALHLNASSLSVFRIVVGSYGVLNLIMCVLLLIFVKDEYTQNEQNQKFNLKKTYGLIKDKRLWYVAGIMFCNYLNLAILTYLIPFLSTTFGLEEKYIVIISLVRTNVVTIVASFAAGLIADKLGSVIQLHQYSFMIGFAGSIVLLTAATGSITLFMVIAASFIVTFVEVGSKSVNMVMLSDVSIPKEYFGTAVGLVSFIAFSPDAFFYQIAGAIMDNSRMPYQILFCILVVSMGIGVAICRHLRKMMRTEKA